MLLGVYIYHYYVMWTSINEITMFQIILHLLLAHTYLNHQCYLNIMKNISCRSDYCVLLANDSLHTLQFFSSPKSNKNIHEKVMISYVRTHVCMQAYKDGYVYKIHMNLHPSQLLNSIY